MICNKISLENIAEKGSSSLMQKDLKLGSGDYPIYGASGLLGYVDFYHQENESIGIVKDGAGVGRVFLLPAKASCIGTMQYIIPKAGVDAHFLFYALENMNLSRYNTGATIPHIYFRDYKGEKIPEYRLDEQKKIAKTLDKLRGNIEKRKKQLQKFDDLVKSQFIEMFGAVGADEKGWGLIALGECCELNPKKSDDDRLKEGVEVSFVPMPAVTEKGELDNSSIRLYEQVQKGFTYFADNDVLFAKITPCMENGKGAVARGLKNGIGFGSTEFHVLRPKAGVSNPVWLYTIMSFKQFRQDAARKMTGSAGQRRVPSSFLSGYKVSLPPIALQNQFAIFVERTDKSKFRIKQSLEKLEICYKALLQKYFG